MSRQWKSRVSVRLRPFENETNRDAAHALRNALASYWFGRRPYQNTAVLWYFGKAFARLANTQWIVFGFVPECVIERATVMLSRHSSVSLKHARRNVLDLIQELRFTQKTMAA